MSQISLNSLHSHYTPRDLIISFSPLTVEQMLCKYCSLCSPKFLLVRELSNYYHYYLQRIWPEAQTQPQSMPQCPNQSVDKVNPLHPKAFPHNNPITRCHTRNYQGNPALLGRCSSLSADYTQGILRESLRDWRQAEAHKGKGSGGQRDKVWMSSKDSGKETQPGMARQKSEDAAASSCKMH